MDELDTLKVSSDHYRPHTQMEGVIGLAEGFLTAPIEQEDTGHAALDFVAANRDLVGDDYDLYAGQPFAPDRPINAITPVRQTPSPAGYHVELQQFYQGVPFLGSTAVVHMTRERRVYFFTNDTAKYLPDLEVYDILKAGIKQLEAVALVGERLPSKSLDTDLRIKLGIVPRGKGWRLAWCIDIIRDALGEVHAEEDRSGDWRALVDVETGEIELLDAVLPVGGEARVFYPNPVVALREEGMNAAAGIPQHAYRAVELLRLDGSGYLRGRYADTSCTPNCVNQPNHVFNFDRSHPGFEEVMAYYFVDNIVAWLGRLGWPNLFEKDGSLDINAHAHAGDVSGFRALSWALHLGDGGVNDAEDASIVIHELGHAIQHAQGWRVAPKNSPVRAMGEGFGDWLAAVYFAEERRDFHTGWIGDWNARGYQQPSDFLRTVTGPKTMADEVRDDHYQDCEIWSAALWDLFQAMGGESGNRDTRQKARSSAVKLVLQSHHYLIDGWCWTLTMHDGARELLKADRFLSDDPTTPGPYDKIIRDVFSKRKFELPPPY